MRFTSRCIVSSRQRLGAWAGHRHYLVGSLGVLLLIFTAGSEQSLPAQDGAAAIEPSQLVGQKITVELVAGKTIADAEVLKVQEGEVRGCIRLLTILDSATGKPRPLIASTIASLTPADKGTRYVLDKASKRLLPDDPALAEKIQAALADAAQRKAKSKPEKRVAADKPSSPKVDRADSDKSKKAKTAEGEQPIPLRGGVAEWPKLTPEEQKQIVAGQKEYLTKIKEAYPDLRFTMLETEYFLFYGDLTPADLRNYVPYMDAMYKQLLRFFDIKAETPFWRGKAIILIFARDETYVTYQQKFHNFNPGSTAGYYHGNRNGEVVAILRAAKLDRRHLACVLMHETTHGFVWRYRTNARVSKWVDEGLAEYISNSVVPGYRDMQEQVAVRAIQSNQSMSAGFFGTNLNGEQYGEAFNLTKYMIKADSKRYKRFLQCLKAGFSDDDALQEVYGIRRDALIAQYGRALGVPNLRAEP